MRRLPIRVRLTAVFAFATALVLAGAALFVYLRLSDDLNESIDDALRARAAVPAAPSGLAEPEEEFAQRLSPEGAVLDSSGGIRGPSLEPADAGRASRRELIVERRLDGIEGTARVLGRPGPGGTVIAVGQSLNDRDETLEGLLVSFAVGGPIAIVLASLLGYGLATAGLRPVEAMRRRAEEISLRGDDARLPLPAARDEIHRLGSTLNDMLGRLRRSFERERGFVADASHELRTPIAVLKTELESALRAGDHGPATRESLVAAVEECEHLAQLAEDLLVLARATDRDLPVHREQLEARATLERVRERFADRAAEQRRGIRVEAEPDVRLSADPQRLRQALGNLVDNALRHGHGDVLLSARRAGGSVELAVGDDGPGIPTDLGDRAFERFTRGDEARTRGGAGLGLAIVRAIAEAHGGSAAAGDGAVVIRLPAP